MPVDKPATVWIGSPHQSERDAGLVPKVVVLHIMEGSLAACDSWFKNPISKVSAHYGIGKGGAIHQYVDEQTQVAWANGLRWQSGRWYTPGGRPVTPTSRVVQAHPGVNPNEYSISIEHEGKTGESWTAAMLAADVSLIAWLCWAYAIPVDSTHIISHASINPVDKARCPGTGCPFDLIIHRVQARLAGENDAPPVEPDWRVKYIELAGVTDHHRRTLEYIAANSSDAVAKLRATLALAGQWAED